MTDRRIWLGGLVLGIGVAACAQGAGGAARARLELVPATDSALAGRLIDANRVVAGRLLSVQEAEEYEPIGQLVIGIAGSKPTLAAAYRARLQVDSTLLGSGDRLLWVTFFAPRGALVPVAGETAIWVLHRRTLWRLRECAEQESLTSAACPYDIGLALDADTDVRPLDDWSHIQSVLGTLRLGRTAGPE